MNPKMKATLDWAKKNWIVIACVAVPVVAVPAMVWGSLTWNGQVVKSAQERIEADIKDIRNPNLGYKLPGIKPDDETIEFTGAPNKLTNKAFGEARAKQMAAANDIVAQVVAFNKGDRKPLIDGLFPEPPPGNQALQREMARRFNQEAQRELLKSINAQPPISVAEVTSRLNDRKQEFLQRVAASAGVAANSVETQLTAEQVAELQNELVAVRMDAYRSHAARVLTYGDISAFVLPTFGGESAVPSLAECWEWQVQFWIQQDLVRAIGLANSEAKNLGVSVAPVKRLERIVVLPPVVVSMDPNNPTPADGPDWTGSFTGRRSDSQMDVRKAEITLVIANQDLPKYVDALAKTNLMTVTSAKLSSVDIAADLGLGYYYGSASVVRATLTVETVWLREWTGEVMPKSVKDGTGGMPGDPNMPAGGPPPMRGAG